ncbi:MAG: hypothetical protein PHC34_12250 [Candidatus Gastranaerophilales bacterium]|nr:hypothetical protein [Candidatus Gastranaerophilales bacterium]
MSENIFKLYPQYNQKPDRRKNNVSVVLECRSGVDRRESVRYSIDLKLGQDINRTKNIFAPFLNTPQIQQIQTEHNRNTSFRKAVMAALSPLVPVRRISTMPDNIEDKNYTRAAGLVGLMLFNLPEDCRDMRNSIRQISNKILPEKIKKRIEKQFPKIYKTFMKCNKKYDYTKYQHSFSFFRGTWFEPLLELKGKIGEKISGRLYDLDMPLLDTKLGKFIKKTLKINDKITISSGIFDIKDEEVLARSIKGGNKFTRLLGRAMLRMPVLGIYALAFFELPAIINSFKNVHTSKENAESVAKQTAKSAVYVPVMSYGIGILGALGAKKFGATGSLVGMGLGSVVGGIIANKAGEIIDKD